MSACGQTGIRRLSVLDERELLRVQKPAQYLGGELNSVMKPLENIDVRFALSFPDTYEVGMSHLGLQILYDLLNRDAATWAERVFMPMADMEALLREKKLPLCSLESQTPLKNFDAVGFSLQYELCATNILAMLELSDMKFYAADRPDSDPLIIGGGPYSYHPEALTPFFDAFFLGDAEEAIAEVVAAIRSVKKDGGYSRAKVLEKLRFVEGIYIPTDFEARYSEDGKLLGVDARTERKEIVRRLLPTLDGAPYPQRPVVPNIQTVHNRLSLEVMRGCVRGCRFCQAGYLYRPQRERSPREIVEMVGKTLPETGFEELSLLSLSTADYCSIVPLLKTLMDRYAGDDKLAISFPSTRVDALTPEVLEQVQRVRRTGFTVAPEGGTQRLRDVINKGVSDEQILETCANVFRMGWTGIKLYFMLGLPTETDEDLQGIIDIAERVRALPEARGKEITVSVSTHVPKPHTPFQWAEQITPNETVRRQRFLADGLRRAKVTFRYHDAFSSFLEGIFCRSGREFAKVIVRAYELGCRLDAWQEHLKEDLWMQAFLDCNVEPLYYLRERDIAEPLPWDHLSCGIPKSYFIKEWKHALRNRETPDCLTKSCSVCGACNYDTSRNVLWPRAESESLQPAQSAAAEWKENGPLFRYRLRYAKHGSLRYLGHLELVSIFHRACRRAELPLAFSQGFHPLPRLSFGPPLQLGIGSTTEFVDAFFTSPLNPADFSSRLNTALPPDLRIVGAELVDLKAPSLQESLILHRFRVEWLSEPRGVLGDWLPRLEANPEAVTEFLDEVRALEITRLASGNKKRNRARAARAEDKTFRLGDFVPELLLVYPEESGEPPAVEFSLLVDHTRACPKPTEVVAAFSGCDIGDYSMEKTGAEMRSAGEAAATAAGPAAV